MQFLGMRPKTIKSRIMMTLDSKPLTGKYATGSNMRYRHNSSTPAQSCARGWLQQSLKTQEDDMCECIVHNENLYA